MKNRKGFTLVELLAVIVILALIMSIAVVSIGGILDNSKYSTFKETGVSVINAVRQRLLVAGELRNGTNYYYFKGTVLEKGNEKTSFGSNISYIGAEGTGTNAGKWLVGKTKYASLQQIGDSGVYRVTAGTAGSSSQIGYCVSTSKSFVKVVGNIDTGVFTYSICLTSGSGNKYIYNATEDALLNSSDNSMIK